MSPRTIPSDSVPTSTAADPVTTPPRTKQPRHPDLLAERRDRLGERERRAHRPFRVVLASHRRAPDRHHCVADELLDRAAQAFDQRAAALEVLAEELADVLGVTMLGQRREADQVGEQHRDEPSLGDRGRGCGRRRLPGVSDQRGAT